MQDVARQRMKIQEYCDRNNYEIVQEIVDYGISGAKADRGGYVRNIIYLRIISIE